MLPYLALVLLFPYTTGFERSVKSHIAHSSAFKPPRPPELYVPDASLKEKIADGAKAIAKFQDSPCWMEAKAGLLVAQCNNLRSEEKDRLIIALVNCHLERTGNSPILCSPETPVSDCLKLGGDINRVRYETFTGFSLHFENMCFSVKRDAFEEDTQRAVNSLYVATLDTSENLQSFAQKAEEARAYLMHEIKKQEEEFNHNLNEFHTQHMEKFGQLSEAAENLDKKQEGMVDALQQKSAILHNVLESSLAIQKDVQSNQSSLLAQFSRANQTLSRLEDQQEAALALVNSARENLEDLTLSQRRAFSETNQSLFSLAHQQTVIDSSLQKSLESSTQLNAEQTKLFDLLSQQNAQLETRHRDFLDMLSATKQDLNELSFKQKVSFETSAQQVSHIANKTSSFAQHIHTQLDESKKIQEIALKSVSGGFAAISLSTDEINQKQQQLLLSVAGTHGKLEELQKKNKDSFEEASGHLTSIRQQSQLAEERVQKVLQGLENRLEAGFQRLLALDYSILGELFTIKAIVFYVSCAVGIFLCTASKSTNRIRPHLFAALGVAFYAETQSAYFTEWFLFSDHLYIIAYLRKLFVISICAALAVATWRFRDFHQLSYEVAMQNQNMLHVIMQHLRRKAMCEHFDTRDLDEALSQVTPSRDPKIFSTFGFETKCPELPPLERVESKEAHESVGGGILVDDEETEDQGIDDVVEEPFGVEQVVEEPEAEERDIVPSPRCAVITKSSGLPCRLSARKCKYHRT